MASTLALVAECCNNVVMLCFGGCYQSMRQYYADMTALEEGFEPHLDPWLEDGTGDSPIIFQPGIVLLLLVVD